MVRRRMLAELLRRHRRGRRQHPIRRLGGLYGRQRDRDHDGLFALHVPRQHDLPGDAAAQGLDDIRLFADRAADLRECAAQPAQLGHTRALRPQHPPRLVRRGGGRGAGGYARAGHQQHDDTGRLLRLLLPQCRVDDQAFDGHDQSRLGGVRRAAPGRAVHQLQPPYAQLFLCRGQPHDGLEHTAHEGGLFGDQPHGFPGLCRLQGYVRQRAPPGCRGGLRIHARQTQQLRRAGAGRRVGQAARARRRDFEHRQLSEEYPHAGVPDLLFRACELRLRRALPPRRDDAHRRFVEIRRRPPLGLFPGGIDRMGGQQGGVLARKQCGQHAQGARELRADGQQRDRAVRHLRQLQFALHLQRQRDHHDQYDAQQRPDLGEDPPVQRRHRPRAAGQPHHAGARLLQQGDARPAVRRQPPQYDGLQLGFDQPGARQVLRHGAVSVVGQHRPQGFFVEDGFHVQLQHEPRARTARQRQSPQPHQRHLGR